MGCCYRNGSIRKGSVDRSSDFTSRSINREVSWQVCRSRPRSGTVVEWWMEANGIDGLVLNDRVCVVRIDAEVQFMRGGITALIGVNRVGLIVGINRRCSTDDAVRDTHSCR